MFPGASTPLHHPSAYKTAQSSGFLSNISDFIGRLTNSTAGSLRKVAAGIAGTNQALQEAYGLARVAEGLTGVKTGAATIGKAIDATSRAHRDVTHEETKYSSGTGPVPTHVPRHERPNPPRKRRRRRGGRGGTRRAIGGGLEGGE